MAPPRSAQAYCVRMDTRLRDPEWLAGDFGYADIAFYMATLFGERQGAPLTAEHSKQRLVSRVRGRSHPLFSLLYNNKYIEELVGALAAGFKGTSRICQQPPIRGESPDFDESFDLAPVIHSLWMPMFPCGQSLEWPGARSGSNPAIGLPPPSR